MLNSKHDDIERLRIDQQHEQTHALHRIAEAIEQQAHQTEMLRRAVESLDDSAMRIAHAIVGKGRGGFDDERL